MKKPTIRVALCAIATFVGLGLALPAFAQSERENSTFTITAPLDVGSVTLQPGTYLIRVVMLSSDRDTVQVTDPEQKTVFATALATPHPIAAGEANPNTRYVYYVNSENQPIALRTWYGRDTTKGHDIVYPKKRALELAAAAKAPVYAMREEVKEAEYKAVPLEVVTPEQKVTPYTAPPVKTYEAPPPVKMAEARPPARLPKTASRVPLFAALGLLSLGGAFGLRALANRSA